MEGRARKPRRKHEKTIPVELKQQVSLIMWEGDLIIETPSKELQARAMRAVRERRVIVKYTPDAATEAETIAAEAAAAEAAAEAAGPDMAPWCGPKRTVVTVTGKCVIEVMG
jgi:hypothetical protein